jgi:hypothetical protein
LITHNKRHFTQATTFGINVLAPGEFLASIIS